MTAKDKSPKQRIRIRLKAYDHRIIDKSARKILETAERTGALVAGRLHLRAGDEVEELGNAFVFLGFFTRHHPQAGAADHGDRA